MQHLLTIDQFYKTETITQLFNYASYNSHTRSSTNSKKMASLFFEPSTRTRLSFESAMLNLGGKIITVSDSGQCSGVKGESLEDTITTVSNYVDVIVLRHPEQGAALKAASVATVPIINAGDGAGEHPTQALLDAYTIYKHFNTLTGLNILLSGDLASSRTVKSLVKLLTLFGHNTFHTLPISERSSLCLPEVTIRAENVTQNDYVNAEMKQVLQQEKMDVIYLTRPQKERWNDTNKEPEADLKKYQILPEHLSLLKEDAIIMHPLPRNDEIHKAVDKDPRAVYFTKQVKAGVAIRMAILDYLLFKNDTSQEYGY